MASKFPKLSQQYGSSITSWILCNFYPPNGYRGQNYLFRSIHYPSIHQLGISLFDGVVSHCLPHVTTLVASYDKHGCLQGYSCFTPPCRGKASSTYALC